MVDIDMLREKFGLTEDNLKKWLYMDMNAVLPGVEGPEVQRNVMRNRIRSRIQENLNRNLSEGRHYYALDQAWDTPFRQVTPTLLQSLMDKDKMDVETERIVSNWGLAHLLTEETDPKTGRKTGKKRLNVPMFFNVFVPLVKAYVTIRWAKIVNDRRLTPFMKYEPAKSTAFTRLKCEAITDRVQMMSVQYSYFEDMKQAVLKMLHYSYCIQFIKEEWDTEEQWTVATEADLAAGEVGPDGVSPVKPGIDLVKQTIREGLRFHRPHPCRTIRDLAHEAWTLNADRGCEYAGYWRIMRYRELLGGQFWNIDRISIGATDLIGDNRVFFTTVYPCNISWPTGVAVQGVTPTGATLAVESGAFVGELDREKKMADQFYTTDRADQAVLVTEYFEKLVPKDNGMGDYDCPVWFRFVVAGDQATILYAAPLPSCPAVYYGYDEDASRAMNASLTLEVLPFQDQFGNMFSQLLLTVKQNLANVIFVDEDQVKEEAWDRMQNYGERWWRSLNVQPFSSRRARVAQNRTQEAIQSFKFPQGNTSEIIQCLKTILDTLERVLVMSSQEVGQAASHEQTREEIMNIAQSSSSRQVFTSIPVDIAREAWKRQIYSYLMAYGQEEFYAHVPSEMPLTPEVLTAIGIAFTDEKSFVKGRDKWRRIKTTLTATAMELYEFAGTKDGEDRTNEKELAQTLGGILQQLMQNPITAQAIGTQQCIMLTNQILYWAGLPKDVVLHDMSPAANPEQQQQQAQAQLQQAIQIVTQKVEGDVAKGLHPLMDEVQKHSAEIGAILRALQLAPPHPSGDALDQTAPTGIRLPKAPQMAQPNGSPVAA